MRIAQVIGNKAHWIFEADAIPDWPPGPDGEPLVFVDITDMPDVAEGWLYDAETGAFTAPEEPEPVPVPELPAPATDYTAFVAGLLEGLAEGLTEVESNG